MFSQRSVEPDAPRSNPADHVPAPLVVGVDVPDPAGLFAHIDRELPTAPSGFVSLVTRLNLRTLRDLLLLDPSATLAMRGVGPTKCAALTEWRVRLLGENRLRTWTTAVEEFQRTQRATQADVLPDTGASRPFRLPTPPNLIQKLVAELNIRTVQDLAPVHTSSLLGRPFLGPKRIAAFERWQSLVLSMPFVEPSPPEPTPAPPPPATLAELDAVTYADDQRHAGQILRRRLREGESLATLAAAFDRSRERIRQIIMARLHAVNARFPGVAMRLLLKECDETSITAGVLHRSCVGAATVPFESLGAALALTGEDWVRTGADWWVIGGDPELTLVTADVDAWVDGRVTITEGDLADAPLPRAPLIAVLEHRLGFIRSVSGWDRTPEPPSFWAQIEDRLRDEGGPLGQRELTEWLLEQPHFAALGDYTAIHRKLEGGVGSRLTIWRVGKGTFVHQDHLPLPEAQLIRLRDRCLKRMRGATTTFSTDVLLTELRRTEKWAQHLTPWLLKDTLRRHPKILALRKLQVGYAPTFADERITTVERIRRVLAAAEVPLTLAEIRARLPPELDHTDIAIRSALTLGAGRHVGDDRYAAPDSPLATVRRPRGRQAGTSRVLQPTRGDSGPPRG